MRCFGILRCLAAWLWPLLLLGPAAQAAPEKARLRFAMDWVLSGAHAPFLLAVEGGHFAHHGLQVTLTRGQGAADTARRVASGESDFGVADLGVLTRHNALLPTQQLTAVYLVHDRSPLAVITLEEKAIHAPADLRGKVVGAPEAEAGRTLFPLLAAQVGLERHEVQWTAMEPALRESLLVAGRVDAITGYAYTAHFLELQGVKRERIRILRYADHGLPLYGVAVFARADFLRAHPQAATAFVRAVHEALLATIANPPLAIEALRRRQGDRLPPELELQRLRTWLEDVVTPHVRRHGLSQVDPARLARSIELVVGGLKLPAAPDPRVLYTEAFLPPRAERLLSPAPRVVPCHPVPNEAPLPGCR